MNLKFLFLQFYSITMIRVDLNMHVTHAGKIRKLSCKVTSAVAGCKAMQTSLSRGRGRNRSLVTVFSARQGVSQSPC